MFAICSLRRVPRRCRSTKRPTGIIPLPPSSGSPIRGEWCLCLLRSMITCSFIECSVALKWTCSFNPKTFYTTLKALFSISPRNYSISHPRIFITEFSSGITADLYVSFLPLWNLVEYHLLLHSSLAMTRAFSSGRMPKRICLLS